MDSDHGGDEYQRLSDEDHYREFADPFDMMDEPFDPAAEEFGIMTYDDDDDDGAFDLGSEEEEESLFDEDEGYPETPEEKISRQEQLRMMHLRSHLNQLTEKVKHHQYMTEKNREELKQCRDRINQLEGERDQVFLEIQSAESDENTSALYRLRTQHERICKELEGEQELESMITENLNQSEYELAKSEVDRGKFLLAEDELIKKEQRLAKEKTELALDRLTKEERKAKMALKRKKTQDRIEKEVKKERERRHMQALDEAKRSKEKHSKYLDDTVNKLRNRQEEETVRYKDEMQRKMDMLLKLKADITSNRENLKALRARDKAMEKKEKTMEEMVRQQILEDGGNPDEALLIQKRISEFERQKMIFEVEQKEKQADIMQRVLVEEQRMKKRKKQHPQLWTDPKREKNKIIGPHKKKPLKTMAAMTETTLIEPEVTQVSITDRRAAESDEEDSEEAGDDEEAKQVERVERADSTDSSESETEEHREANLAKPEFEGLWDHHKPYKVPKDLDTSVRLPGGTKMEKEILTKVLAKHRSGIVTTQVAAGREFKGCPFYSKPDIIHFKDFEVGRMYKKKVALTNVSYTVNYCKYIGITERLKDFIEIHFDPPGQMSAGLTCEMLVTFKPRINEDLVGEVNFLSQTGPFSIPLQCTTKKCNLSVDINIVEFGTTVIGETLKRHFTLTNKGALGTKFEFFKVTGTKQRTLTTAETSIGRLTTADTNMRASPDSTDPGTGEKTKKLEVPSLEKVPEEKPTEVEGEKTGDLDQEAGEAPGEGQQEGDAIPEEGEAVDVDVDAEEEQPPEEQEDGALSPDLAVSEVDDYGTLDGMKVGPIVAGDIGPFASVKLEIIWQPTIPGKVDSEFMVTFTDPLSENISVHALANAIDVPVWVERQNVDLKICMFDRLYQDTIIVNNRATTALRLKFEVCKELQNHLELLPKTGYIQAQSQFSAQLKFLPRQSLFEDAGKYFDKETGVLEAPMTIRVADQTQPVPFIVHAVVTNSDMEFDVTNIDFGYCTIYESVKTTIKLTNKSILSQEFGFVGLPDYVEVQPNDGFGTLLPLETIDLEVVFSPKKARDYKFELVCKSLINREFRIECKGVGVYPPLELSQQVVHFAATSVYDVSMASLHVINSHTSMNEFTHPVPRIGKGEIAPVGPTSFEFVVPEGAPITISPSVGTIQPGKKCHVHVRFAPKLKEEDIVKEAVRMATKMAEAKAKKEHEEALKREREAQEQAQESDKKSRGKKDSKNDKEEMKAAAAGGKKPSAKEKASPVKAAASAAAKAKTPQMPATITVSGPKPFKPPDPSTITEDSAAYAAAVGSLLRQFKSKFQSVTVPCYVASGPCGNPGETPYSIYNTLYLEVRCPTVKPPVVVISDSGKTTLNFDEVSIGQNIIKSITIQNISNKTIELKSSVPDTDGPFQMLNSLRMLPPDGTHTMLISFTPTAGRVFQEILEIKSPTASMYIMMCGKGVSPLVNLSSPVDMGVMDMGAVLVGEYHEKTFKMQNTSSLSIEYSIKLESLSLLRHSKAQTLPAYLNPQKKSKYLVGTQNNSGQNVFDLVPSEGTIPPGGSIEINCTFAPDHTSDFYSDNCRIELFGKEESHSFQLKGTAKPHVMYVDGVDERTPDVESLCEKPKITDEEDAKPGPEPVLFTLRSIAKESEFVPASRELLVGCVRTMAVSQKKQGEFQFENVPLIQAKGFNLDPQKGMVEAGTARPITVTWTPPPNFDPNQTMESSVLLTMKGDTTDQVKVMLHAMVVSE